MKHRSEPDKLEHPYVVQELHGQKPYVGTYVNNHGHVIWDQSESLNQDSIAFPVHRLIAISEWGFEAVCDKHVHHKNGIPWDNRPDNLELLDPSDHARVHGGPYIPKHKLLDDLVAGAAVLGRPPSATELDKFGEYSYSVYRQRFGSLEDALEEAGLDVPETRFKGRRK